MSGGVKELLSYIRIWLRLGLGGVDFTLFTIGYQGFKSVQALLSGLQGL